MIAAGWLLSARNGFPLKLAAEISGRMLTFLLPVLIAQRMGQAGLGEFQYAWSMAWIAAFVADLGLTMQLTADVARLPDSHRSLLGRAFCMKAITGTVVVSALIPFASPIVVWLTLAVVFSQLTDTISATYRGRRRMDRDAAVSLAGRLVGFLGGTLPLILGWADLLTASLVMACSQGALLLGLTLIVRPRFDLRGWRETALQALPIGVASVAAMMYLRGGSVLLYEVRGAAVAGEFASAARLCEAMIIIPSVVSAAAFPAMAAMQPRAARETARLLAFAALAVSSLLAVFSRPLLSFLFGFDTGAGVLRVLAVALVPTFVNAALLHELLARRRQRVNAIINVMALAANLGLNALLVPHFGSFGTAWAWLATETGIGIAALLALLRRRPARDAIAAPATLGEVFP